VLIVGSLLQAGVQRAHVLYLAWVLLGLVILHSGWGASNQSAARPLARPNCEQAVSLPKMCADQSAARSSHLPIVSTQP
jgi:hypothetical protein